MPVYGYLDNPTKTPKLSVAWTEPTRRITGIFIPNVSWLSKSLRKRREI
jgi:hypothetical protein